MLQPHGDLYTAVTKIVSQTMHQTAQRKQLATVKPCPYQPDHQVELLHLQAEADALMVKLQAAGQRQMERHQAV